VKEHPVSIVFTENIGPHRKLLPLLSRKWNEDCVIMTTDDDLGYINDFNILGDLTNPMRDVEYAAGFRLYTHTQRTDF
jgi:hypothetical protein